MWVNLLNILPIEHVWYDGKCSHGTLKTGDSQWIEKDSRSMADLREIVLKKAILKSFPFYTRFQ